MNKKSAFQKIKNSRVVRVIFARKSVVFCLAVLLLLILAAIFALIVAPYDPYKQDLKGMLQGMGPKHILVRTPWGVTF